MPESAIDFALAASVYPPALAAVIALGRGEEVRLRVILLVIGAYFAVFVTGLIMLALFWSTHLSDKAARSPSAWVYIALGIALLCVAWRVRNKPPGEKSGNEVKSKLDRYLDRRWLVLILGVVLYVIPSPIYAGAVKSIADSHASGGTKVGYLTITLLIMLWMIELPVLMLIAVPDTGQRILESINSWFGRNAKELSWIAALVVALYLIVTGLIELS